MSKRTIKIAISKEQWGEIEQRLKGYSSEMFFLDGHEILVKRARVSEAVTKLAVFIDGEIGLTWADEDSKNYDPELAKIVKKVWRYKFFPYYSAKKLADAKKKMTKKMFLELFGVNPEKKGVYRYEPLFPSAKPLVSHFKKIDGLELLKRDGD